MSNKISVHDNFVLSYMVNCQERQITLYTVYVDQEPNEHTNIIFTGVAAHYFERDNFQTILFDVEEASLEHVYSMYQEVFERNKNYCWPNISYSTQSELIAALKVQSIKGFLISSSFGMDGLVLAQEMQIVPAS